MKTVFRVDLSAWTASFRYPNLISGVQPTLDVPPLSTVLGLLNAAAGQYLTHKEGLEIGYYFEFAAKEYDLETIHAMGTTKEGKPSNSGKSNVVKRQFLFDTKLSIYLTDKRLVDLFRQPYYQLLLGRSGDLATVEQINEVVLAEIKAAKQMKGQIIPIKGNMLPGVVQALPRYFTNTFPRQNIGTEAYSVISHHSFDIQTSLNAWRDESQGKNGVDIYFHQFDLSNYE
jgi:CRISPR-associated protein Cas5t